MRERNDGMFFLVPLFCFMSVLPLEKDMFVSFVSPVSLSVVHRTVYTSARSCLSARAFHVWTHVWLKIPRLCRPPKNVHIITTSCMLAHERSTPLTRTPSSSIPSSRTTFQVKLPINKSPVLRRQEEESGSLANITSSTRYEPNNFDYSETAEIFLQEQSSDKSGTV